VPLRASKIIYELIERVRSDVAALLPPLKEIRVTGEATVQQIFDIRLKGKETLRIAGSRVSNGQIEMKEGVRARVLRGKDREVVHEGEYSYFCWTCHRRKPAGRCGHNPIGAAAIMDIPRAKPSSKRANANTTGVISTLKHLKKDATEVRKGTECGIGLEGFSDIREGDEVITFTTVEVPRTL
jgi:translation initiation factor IF-2